MPYVDDAGRAVDPAKTAPHCRLRLDHLPEVRAYGISEQAIAAALAMSGYPPEMAGLVGEKVVEYLCEISAGLDPKQALTYRLFLDEGDARGRVGTKLHVQAAARPRRARVW